MIFKIKLLLSLCYFNLIEKKNCNLFVFQVFFYSYLYYVLFLTQDNDDDDDENSATF